MKQKIVIKVSMHCSKCRTEALKIAAAANGVTSVALEGPEKEKLMVLGEGVDAACLTEALRKKLCHASIEIVEQMTEAPAPNPPPPPPETAPSSTPIIYCQPPQVEYFRVVSDPSPAPCTIM